MDNKVQYTLLHSEETETHNSSSYKFKEISETFFLFVFFVRGLREFSISQNEKLRLTISRAFRGSKRKSTSDSAEILSLIADPMEARAVPNESSGFPIIGREPSSH